MGEFCSTMFDPFAILIYDGCNKKAPMQSSGLRGLATTPVRFLHPRGQGKPRIGINQPASVGAFGGGECWNFFKSKLFLIK
jgi:hypothetical protein